MSLSAVCLWNISHIIRTRIRNDKINLLATEIENTFFPKSTWKGFIEKSCSVFKYMFMEIKAF